MILRPSWVFRLALAIQCATAFKNTSPFFLFSTSRLSEPPTSHFQLASSSSISAQVEQALSSCPSDTYIIISQPSVSASDFSSRTASPNLRQYLNKTNGVQESWVVPEVAGMLDASSFERLVEERCGADVLRIDATTGSIPNDGVYPRSVFVRFPTVPTSYAERRAKLEEHDSFLHAVISEVCGDKYTVIYMTTPPAGHRDSHTDYEFDDDHFQAILHTDMKRDVGSNYAKNNGSDLALFDKYEFLSPGVFMGLFVGLILFLILWVGISAVASLQVSYFAFSKEMGPSQQKKQ